ncbi:type II toxin-antitoxin system HigB family toxin [Dyadobacter arcticus]|uniref:mRNA interferase HigB n=1 Tax=Dyadobacter arcticus TaxID=1078754 RepID=A0ABX0UQL1_9BACT|nr:type II toxin-antitoxin system HigB family toxin [Dyadobacter arcticus]NIJ55283.1 mRNA interferase HigB [Dyadobacter arcticus]
MIREFSRKHHESLEALDNWHTTVKKANWSHFHDVKKVFNSVDAIGNDLYVFNIKGNHIRMIVRIAFKIRTVYIKFIGTHSQYDKVNPDNL